MREMREMRLLRELRECMSLILLRPKFTDVRQPGKSLKSLTTPTYIGVSSLSVSHRVIHITLTTGRLVSAALIRIKHFARARPAGEGSVLPEMGRGVASKMNPCLTGEVRGSKRKGLAKLRSNFSRHREPGGRALVAREGRALSQVTTDTGNKRKFGIRNEMDGGPVPETPWDLSLSGQNL
jgi:hypothetical protein